jgi:hypothetical protein
MTHYISNPTLNAVYQAWQRHRDANPQGALRVVEVYAQVHGVPARDLLRRFAEAEAREASLPPPLLAGFMRGSTATPCTPPPAPGPFGAFPCAKVNFREGGGLEPPPALPVLWGRRCY